MVNRGRSETWTSGVKNDHQKQRLYSCNSESNLENLNSHFSQSNDSLNFDPISRLGLENFSWDKNEYKRQTSNRPVYSTSSMESVSLSEKDSFDVASVSSIHFEPCCKQEVFVENAPNELGKSHVPSSHTPRKESEKSTLGSIFNW